MRFTASDNWNSLANAASKRIVWNIYARNISATSLYQSIADYSGWSNVTSRLIEIPDITNQVEYSVGQFSANSVNLQGSGINYWQSNFFDPTSSLTSYTEMKIEACLSGASDTAIVFSGVVNKDTIEPSELEDMVSFDVISYDDLGNIFIGENITTQYINTDINGSNSGVSGIQLSLIPGVFVVSANVTDYVLQAGQHTIDYRVSPNETSTGNLEASLDGGLWVSLTGIGSDGNPQTYTLGNGEATSSDTQRIKLYVKDTYLLPASGSSNSAVRDYVVVTNPGDIFPKQWYTNISVQSIVNKIYNQIGITGVDYYSRLVYPVINGGSKVSFINSHFNTNGRGTPVIAGGTPSITHTWPNSMYLGQGNAVYEITSDTSWNEPLTSFASNAAIERMWYSYRAGDHDHLWIFFRVNSGTRYVCVYDLGSGTASNTLSFGADVVNPYAVELFDNRYDAQNNLWLYNLAYVTEGAVTNAFSKVYFDTPITIAKASICAEGEVCINPLESFYPDRFGYKRGASGQIFVISGGFPETSSFEHIPFQIQQGTGGGYWKNYNEISATRESIPVKAAYKVGTYNNSEDRIYYYPVTGGQVRYHSRNNTSDNLLTATPYAVAGMFSTSGGWNGATDDLSFFSYPQRSLYSVSGGTNIALLRDDIYCGNGSMLKYTDPFDFTSSNHTTIYGVDNVGRIFSYGGTLHLTIAQANFGGMTIKDALNTIFQSFNVVGMVSSIKRAYVSLRGTYGSNQFVTINNSMVNSLSVDNSTVRDITYVEVSNGKVTWSFDGTNWNSKVLPTNKQIQLSSEFIDSNIVQELAYYIWEFFSEHRLIYKVSLGALPLFQYECLDAASIELSDTRIEIPSSTLGLIYRTNMLKDGTLELEIYV